MILKCIIVDDEPLAIKILEKYISKLPNVKIEATCEDALEALTIIKSKKIDLIFLDINMPKLSGISFVRALKNPPLIIFTTAYPEYAVEGFELEAVDYLLKPFSFERFLKAVEKAEGKLTSSQEEHWVGNEHIFIKSDKKLFRVLFDEILYLEAYGDYVKVHTRKKMLLTKQKLTVLAKGLPDKEFIQSHRSFIISIKAIDYIEGNSVQIAGNKLPISAGNRQKGLEAIG